MGAVLFLLLTNPSKTDFSSYAYSVTYKSESQQPGRIANVFIASLYKYRTRYYIGIAGNFIRIM